jgi:hypothetical protein
MKKQSQFSLHDRAASESAAHTSESRTLGLPQQAPGVHLRILAADLIRPQ